jgi:hypothetical protein
VISRAGRLLQEIVFLVASCFKKNSTHLLATIAMKLKVTERSHFTVSKEAVNWIPEEHLTVDPPKLISPNCRRCELDRNCGDGEFIDSEWQSNYHHGYRC